MAPPKYRGAFSYGFQLFVGVGSTVAFLINYGSDSIAGDLGWRIPLAAAALPALLLTVGAIFLPETPNNLIQRGYHPDKVKRSLQRIRGTEDVKVELADLIAANQRAAEIQLPFKNILRKEYRPQLVMSVALSLFQQMTGINVITFYAPILFRTIGYGERAALMSTIAIAVAGTGMGVFSSLIVDKFGRRVLFHIGGIQMFVSQVAIGGIMAAKLGDYGALSAGYSNLLLILICIYTAGFGWSWGPLGWVVSSEIYPLKIRAAAQSLYVGVSFFTSFIVGQTFLAMLCWMKSGTFFFYGAWVAVMTGFVYFLLPETKGVPIEKMEVVWKEHRFWKSFVCHGNEFSENEVEDPLLR